MVFVFVFVFVNNYLGHLEEKDLSYFVLILAEFSPRLDWSRRLQSTDTSWPNTNTKYIQIEM